MIYTGTMKLILALGNPESRYDGTRHNVGFFIADEVARQFGASFQEKSKFKALIAEATVGQEHVIIAKPTTFYNLVGESYRALADFYKIAPQDTLIIADDLALPFGTMRLREGGSGGGSNGIKSLNAHGGEATRRLRIGVWNELRERMDDADFVLSKFSADEQKALNAAHEHFQNVINDFIAGNFTPTTSTHI